MGKAPKVTPPQPIVLDDDNDDDEEEVTFKRPPPVFIMSGIEAAVSWKEFPNIDYFCGNDCLLFYAFGWFIEKYK